MPSCGGEQSILPAPSRALAIARSADAAPNLIYTPATNYNGSDSFTFTANDGHTNSLPATISLTIRPVNDRPVADGQSIVTDEDAPVNPSAPTVEVLGSKIKGDMSFSAEQGRLLDSTVTKEWSLRTTMRIRPPGGRGSEFVTEVVTKSNSTTTIKPAK